ncbi:SycD/LcrH family type III secretion system chaperone [Spartinivicinus poritis]|uniref:SycD/LcrH family type III secretion system chaperone n=1 Tax=Spartinivicinus poritis TaxID=2994640 RepID=A0ABT5U771_9GAMM|nr:SycD/LcrH family type III secretion system chaperone [Spartinivicinus sp. A2-2]MDE1461009.1 SycD/LcrH family type III secretion system chaperone [Spartinivicinus sp. A2-2]
MAATNNSTSEQDKPNFEELFSFFGEGGALRDLTSFDDETIETAYAVAYQYYESGKYQEASKMFHLLCSLDHYQAKFFIGLGACRHMLKEYQAAIDAFSYVSVLEFSDPRAPFYAAECHLALNNIKEAESGFRATIEFAKGNKEYHDLKIEAENKLNMLLKLKNRKTDL